MINFNALPKEFENGNKIIPAGKYTAVVVKAEMKTSKSSNSSYLNIMFECYNDKNEKVGNVFDKQFDSDKAFLQTKLRKFIEAIKLNLSGEFELADLPKVCLGKKCIITVKIGKDMNDNDQNEIDVFNDGYLPIVEVNKNSEFLKVAEEETDVPFAMNEPQETVADSDY